MINQWTQAPTIKFLRLQSNNPHIPAAVLSACPNLHYLKLAIRKLEPLRALQQPNENLKRLTIVMTSTVWSSYLAFRSLFASIPNLERLCIERLLENANAMNRLKKSDWLVCVLADRLPNLQQFKLILYLCEEQDCEKIDCKRLETSFKNCHDPRYKSQLIFKCKKRFFVSDE